MADHEARIDLGIRGLGPAEHIGRGGFADVYKAEQLSLRRTVAVKVLRAQAGDAETEARFQRECHALGAVSDHPHIVGVHEGGFTRNGRAYLVMEYLPGGSLWDRLADHGPMSTEQVVDTGAKIARALGEAHRAGVLHRDVKPANIMISAYGEPALGDFGIARIEGGHQTATGLLTASFAHAAPEVLEGQAPSALADVYSLGSTIFELLVGRAPYYDPTDESIWPLMKRILSEPMPTPESVGMNRQLGRVFQRATARDPLERYEDADHMADELATLAADGSVLGRSGAGSALADAGATRQVAPPGPDQTPPPDSGSVHPGSQHSGSQHSGSQNSGSQHLMPTDPMATNPMAGAPAVVGTPGGPPAPKPDLTSLRQAGTEVAPVSPDRSGRFAPGQTDRVARMALAGDDFSSDPSDGGAAGRDGSGRRTGVALLVGAFLVLGVVAAGAVALLINRGDDPASDGPVTQLAEAGEGPLLAGTEYRLDVPGAPNDARFRLLVDGEPTGDQSDVVPALIPTAGRHRVSVEISSVQGTEISAPVDLYAIGPPAAEGYVANLETVDIEQEGWAGAMAAFDRLVADGHDDLALAPSDEIEGLTANRWVLFVPGFGDQAESAEDYCRRFDLEIPGYCYAGYHRPVG